MAVTDRDPAGLGLWPHQLDAVVRCEKYFRSDSQKGCLVHMPTGTGKTGVMAVLATRRAVDRPVLVVCPSAALVAQLQYEFRSEFWDKIAAAEEWRPDLVLQALPGAIDKLADTLDKARGKRVIIVATIQAVQQIYAAGAIGRLKDYVGTVLFDEGHREPAPLWAKVIRGFAVPTVLFSATPFRGDLKIFTIDDDHIHFLPFGTAVEDALIRGVQVEERLLSDDPLTFARQIIGERDQLIAAGVFDDKCKVIVRAASQDAVTDLFDAFVGALAGRDDGVLAIHNNFSEVGPLGAQRRGDVPRLRGRREKFLIHQFMLVEGIDDPACAILAIYEPFTSTRMLVQQVGRLTRQPADRVGTPVSSARVIGRQGDDVSDQWKSFLTYDKACVDNGGKPPLRNGEEVLRKVVDALPPMDYIQGRFRQRLDLELEDLSGDLRFPTASLVFETLPDFSLDEFQADVSALLEEEDRFQHQVSGTADGSCRYHVSLGLTQSPFLSQSLFQAATLDVTIYAAVGQRLYFYDSAGLWIDELPNIGPRVSPKQLQSLLPVEAANAISFIAVKNTDLGPLALRSRTLSARSLERSGAFMGEHMNVVTRATGWVDKTRRSLGFSRSRVHDGDGYGASAEQFLEWCEAVDRGLTALKPPAPLLNRFALPTAIPKDTTPINILVDLQELTEQFVLDGRVVEFDGDGLCVDVVPDPAPKPPGPFRFDLVVDGTVHKVWLKWERKKKKFWVTSSSLSQIKAKHESKVTLTRRLNQLQAFRIITADCTHAYVDGAFYRQDLDLADPNGAGKLVLDLVMPIAGLGKGRITSEKGKPAGEKLKTWRPGSLFRFIDDALVAGRERQVFGPAFTNLVCDDFGTEGGDFIGVDDVGSGRVVFIVCKHKPGDAGVSTSAFYDVSGQGLKNLAFLKSDGVDLPGAATKFDRDWKLTNKEKKTDTVPRKRAGCGSTAFRRLLAATKRAPGTDREIWLVCAGGMLSREALKREFQRKPPQAHVLQFYHLVVSAFAACQSVGVQLKIFCAE